MTEQLAQPEPINSLVIYHGGCSDGFCAAWIANRSRLLSYPGRGTVEYLPAVHGKTPPPDVTGKEVYVLDFSWPLPEMLKLQEQSKSLIVLDHHVTAEPTIRALDSRKRLGDLFIYDVDESGATLAFDYFGGYPLIKQIAEYVKDRDLWRFQLQDSREINDAIQSYPQEFGVWDQLLERVVSNGFKVLAEEGKVINRVKEEYIRRTLPKARMVRIGGHLVPVVNSVFCISEIAGELAKGQPFAACWFQSGDQFIWSLRSTPEGIDVGEIAKQYGGGGHRNASGFQTPTMEVESDSTGKPIHEALLRPV